MEVLIAWLKSSPNPKLDKLPADVRRWFLDQRKCPRKLHDELSKVVGGTGLRERARKVRRNYCNRTTSAARAEKRAANGNKKVRVIQEMAVTVVKTSAVLSFAAAADAVQRETAHARPCSLHPACRPFAASGQLDIDSSKFRARRKRIELSAAI